MRFHKFGYFRFVETEGILAGSPTHDTTFIPSVTGRIDGGTEELRW